MLKIEDVNKKLEKAKNRIDEREKEEIRLEQNIKRRLGL